MKLVGILARELDEWPKADSEYAQIESMSQAGDYQVSHYAGVRQKWRKDLDDWDGAHGYVPCSRFTLSVLATDHATAIVTRADWEAERAKLKAPKANGDGWIRHRGGKCPVEDDVMIQTVMRGENKSTFDPKVLSADSYSWKHVGSNGDVMYYRLHKPAEQPVNQVDPSVVVFDDQICVTTRNDTEFPFKSAVNPIQWRDRIRELDTQRAEVEATYKRQISEITQERESLVQRLAGEGLALVEVLGQPVGDMSDPKNWKDGDLIECLDNSVGYSAGSLYTIRHLDFSRSVVSTVVDDKGIKSNGWLFRNFKWHSRPAS